MNVCCEYAAATMARGQLENNRKLAALRSGNPNIRVLTPQTGEAETSRKLLRETIRTHDLQVHGQTTVANDILFVPMFAGIFTISGVRTAVLV